MKLLNQQIIYFLRFYTKFLQTAFIYKQGDEPLIRFFILGWNCLVCVVYFVTFITTLPSINRDTIVCCTVFL